MAVEKKEIAILGTRGVPASYGGFETFAEELGVRLLEQGYRVRVYCRRYAGQKNLPESYRGMSLRQLPAIRQKYLETPLHSLFSFLDLIFRPCDLVLLCNAANSPFSWIVRLLGVPLIINVDGIERRRAKWNWLGKLWYLIGEKTSVYFASRIVSDAKVISEYYVQNYGLDTEIIAYGAEKQSVAAGAYLQRFNLKPKEYILYVSRLEPENNALGVIKAYRLYKEACLERGLSALPLVIVGDAPYARDYKLQLFKEAEGLGVIFTGFQFGNAYREFRSNCYCYIQATEVGGTHPALVEAMAFGNCIIANDVPEHREVIKDAGLYYAFNDWSALAEHLLTLTANPKMIAEFGLAAEQRAKEEYSWENVTARYVQLFERYLNSTRASS